jgi:hypothetical protein
LAAQASIICPCFLKVEAIVVFAAAIESMITFQALFVGISLAPSRFEIKDQDASSSPQRHGEGSVRDGLGKGQARLQFQRPIPAYP